jgi:hypothetical protein
MAPLRPELAKNLGRHRSGRLVEDRFQSGLAGRGALYRKRCRRRS